MGILFKSGTRPVDKGGGHSELSAPEEKNSQMWNTFSGSIRIKLAQIQRFGILNEFPK